jgi:hypothetical protein
MQIRFCWLAAAVVCFLLGHPWSTTAQTAAPTTSLKPRFGMNWALGGTKADSFSGMAANLGGTVRVGPVFVEVNPLDGTLDTDSTFPFMTYTESNDPYDDDDDYEYCENVLTGDLVRDSNCEPVLRGHNAPTITFGMVVPKTPVFFGAGRRFDDEFSTWYGSGGVMWNLEPSILVVRTNVGSNYFSMTVGLTYFF